MLWKKKIILSQDGSEGFVCVCVSYCFVTSAFFPAQALQALGFLLSGDGDVDSLSADEKSDGEGKNDRMSTSSSSTSITSSTDTQEVWGTHRNTLALLTPTCEEKSGV